VVGKFVKHVIPGVIRPLRVLWNEIIGSVFAVLAFAGIARAWQDIRKQESPVAVVVPIIWTLVMGYFAFSSFLRARRISRSP
jgi:hypothetical protein